MQNEEPFDYSYSVRPCGVELIMKERSEQIYKHGRKIEFDVNDNTQYQLAIAAGRLLFTPNDEGDDLMTMDIFIPEGWNKEIWSKMQGKSYKERLVIAGALIAAEIDRLLNS